MKKIVDAGRSLNSPPRKKAKRKQDITKASSKRRKSASPVSENVNQFIRSITEKKYSIADKYLQREIDSRVKSRILKSLKDYE